MILIGLRSAGAMGFDTFGMTVTSALVHKRGKIDRSVPEINVEGGASSTSVLIESAEPYILGIAHY